MISNTAEELFSSSLNFIMLDRSSIKEAQKRFLAFQESGVIKSNCSFDSDSWFTTDEYSNVGFHFTFNRFSYKQYESVFQLSLKEFIEYVKAYMISLMGNNALSSIRTFLLDMRHITSTNIDSIYGASSDFIVSAPSLCGDFFSMLDEANENEQIQLLISAMDSYADINYGSAEKKQRTLADFDTYFLFGDLLKDYWKSPLQEDERLFYYPLYLWWMITGVLPLRPREFLLTQRNCLSASDDGNYFLKVRRNQLKGNRATGPTYKLADDYIVQTYKIPATLGDEIQKYIDLTSRFQSTELDTLFVTDPHYKKWKQKKHSDSRFLTYTNMNTILKYFYRDVIQERYGLHVKDTYTDSHLSEGDICPIHLGDTRHISLINIMLEGGTPVTTMLLAGHTNESMASHYYSNVKNMIECKTYRQYRKLLSGDVQYEISAPSALPKVGDFHVLQDGARCYSAASIQGQITDCVNSLGPNGEIGYCPSCTYYRREGISYFGADDVYKRQLEDDCNALKDAVEVVRHGNGDVEDIGEVLLKLHSSSLSYEGYLLEKLKNENEGE